MLMSSDVFAAQVLASYINPAGSSSVHTAAFDASSSDNMSQNSSALPAMLQELLSQSCLIPAMSSYLRNDSGRCLLSLLQGENKDREKSSVPIVIR